LKTKNALIIFAKLPVEGIVKTRLASAIGETKAKDFYKLLAEHTFEVAKKNGNILFIPFLFCSEESELEAIKQWTGNEFKYRVQKGKDLGQRMLNAFKLIFENGYEKIVIIGTDAPDLSANHINLAIEKLDSNDVVIGPSNDGGYYLLATKKLHNQLFNEIEWSTDNVRKATKIWKFGLKINQVKLSIKKIIKMLLNF
jgi:rSAM/selenodomain-associated transferase 1